jgi:hypothetical protein
LLKLRSLLAQFVFLVGGGVVCNALLFVGEGLLLVGQLVGSLLLCLLLLQLADWQLEIADIGWTRFIRGLTPNEDVPLLAGERNGADSGAASSAGDRLAYVALREAERRSFFPVQIHLEHLALLLQVALNVRQTWYAGQLLLNSLGTGLQARGVLA